MNDVNEYYAKRASLSTDLYFQVGKTVNGVPVASEQLDILIEQIRRSLKLCGKDKIIDLGCGNGLVTEKVSEFSRSVAGVERNTALYKSAVRYSRNANIVYYNTSIEAFDFASADCNKAFMYEVLQHVDYKLMANLVEKVVNGLKQGGILFIGGIPDEERKWDFYNSKERRTGLYAAIESGEDPMGYWYHKDYLLAVGERLGFKVKIIDQDQRLYTSHYRFDCVFEVPES